MRTLISGLLAFGFSTIVTLAFAADPAVKCQTSKLKEAAKYGQCRVGAESKAVKTSRTANFSKCATKFSTKWAKVESAGAGSCPSSNDFAIVEWRVNDYAFELAGLLSGETDYACALPASGQTISYGGGDDGSWEAGGTLGYTDHADGTVTDLNTGLMWEKKVSPSIEGLTGCIDQSGSCANPHDVDNRYIWTGDGEEGTAFNGSVVTVFLEQLNNRCHADATVSCSENADCAGVNEVCGGNDLRCQNDTSVGCETSADCVGLDGPCGFAGYRDWRLPNSKELMSIVDYGRYLPAIHPAFNGVSCSDYCTDITNPACSCTHQVKYWSSTTFTGGVPAGPFTVHFGHGVIAYSFTRNEFQSVRAVRGGS